VPLIKRDQYPNLSGAAVDPGGRYIFFSARSQSGFLNLVGGLWHIYRLDRENGEILRIILGAGNFPNVPSGSGFGGAARPLLSPDGNFLAFTSRADATNTLRLRDLRSGAERILARGITRDEQEGFADQDVFPGYAFTPDGTGVLLTAGGKIHRIGVANGKDEVIPFSVRVEQAVAEQIYPPLRVEEGELRVRIVRWPTLSPDGRTLAFSALGKIWVMSLPDGEPRRLTTEAHREYAPAFSPDGQWIAYVTWSDEEGGHVWKVSAAGGAPQRLTVRAARYVNPAWSRQGDKIAVVVGNGAEFRGEQPEDDPYLEVRWLASSGGETHLIAPIRLGNGLRFFTVLTFSEDGQRLYFTQPFPSPMWEEYKTALTSIRLDGADKKTLLRFRPLDEVVPSPDGTQAALVSGDNVFVVPLPGVNFETVDIFLEQGALPVKRLTTEGGGYVAWADTQTVTWGFTNKFYRQKLDAEKPEIFNIELHVPRARPSGTLVLRNARLITMKGDEIIARGDIVIENNHIRAIGPSGKLALPKEATSYNLRGKTIIPGLIDVHSHMHQSAFEIIPEKKWQYVANLAYGVTTTRDPSAPSLDTFAQAEMVEAGELLGPRIYSTGYAIDGRAGMATSTFINSIEDARHVVRRYKAYGATSLKDYIHTRRESRQWLAQAAREEKIFITAEGGGNMKLDLTFAIDGYSGFEHNLPVTPLYKDVIELIAQSKIYYTPTLIVSYGGPSAEQWFYNTANPHDDAKLHRFIPHDKLDRFGRRHIWYADDEYNFLGASRGATAIAARGGNVCLGAHGQVQGLGAHWELWALQMGGMSAHEALRSGTLRGAEAMGLAQDLGSIEPGKLADLIVLNSDPLANIRNSADLAYVVLNGNLFDANTMEQLWPVKKPLGKFFWQKDE
jgi:imidazolonepropionase-like amidohydrolase/WD40 repeat protein